MKCLKRNKNCKVIVETKKIKTIQHVHISFVAGMLSGYIRSYLAER